MCIERKHSKRVLAIRRQRKAVKRNLRSKRRAAEANVWPPNPEQIDNLSRLERMFKGIHPLSAFDRMEEMKRGQARERGREREVRKAEAQKKYGVQGQE